MIVAFGACPPAFPQADSADTFSTVDAVVQQAVDGGSIPGAVLVVGHAGKVVHRKAFGSRALEPRTEPMTPDTIFDLASLTKPFTAACVMRLVERGQVRLNDPVAHYLPEFARNGKQEITVRQLLTHFSGLPADLDLKASWSGHAQALQLSLRRSAGRSRPAPASSTATSITSCWANWWRASPACPWTSTRQRTFSNR